MDNKICFVLPCNTFIIPYFKVYDNLMREHSVSYDLLMWDREGVDEQCFGTIIPFKCKDKANSGNIFKVFKYIRFYLFVKRTIKQKKYDRIVFLCTAAGTVAFMSRFLKKNYQKKYWVDIRDYSLEFLPLYKTLLKISLDYSYAFDVSSEGYFEFLPKTNKKYFVTHNIDLSSIEKIRASTKLVTEQVKISFIGNVRYFSLNTKFLDLFKNDHRFVIQYYGTGSERLRDYCDNNNIRNVDFLGRFDFSLTPELYAKTDIINNIYGNSGVDVTTAISNKLYYSVFTDRPILVSPNTYMSRITTELGIGFVVDLEDEDLPNKLYSWYTNFSPNREKMNNFEQKVIREQKDFLYNLKRFLNLK